MKIMKEDVPVMVDEFLAELAKSGTPRQRRIAKNC